MILGFNQRLDTRILYKLLKERPQYANISHRKMPTFPEHCRFVRSKPYAEWFMIEHWHRTVGAIYLTRSNEIGVAVLRSHQRLGIARSAIAWMVAKHEGKRLLANVAPRNEKSKKLFRKMGFREIRETYERS